MIVALISTSVGYLFKRNISKIKFNVKLVGILFILINLSCSIAQLKRSCLSVTIIKIKILSLSLFLSLKSLKQISNKR